MPLPEQGQGVKDHKQDSRQCNHGEGSPGRPVHLLHVDKSQLLTVDPCKESDQRYPGQEFNDGGIGNYAQGRVKVGVRWLHEDSHQDKVDRGADKKA